MLVESTLHYSEKVLPLSHLLRINFLTISFTFIYVCVCVYTCAYATTHMVVKGHLIGVGSCLPPVDLRDLTQVIRYGGQGLYLMSHLEVSNLF